MEAKVVIGNIEKLKTTTEVRVEKEDGEVVDRHLVTKVQFEAEVDPSALANIHRLLAAEAPVSVIIGSPQAIMELAEQEPVMAKG